MCQLYVKVIADTISAFTIKSKMRKEAYIHVLFRIKWVFKGAMDHSTHDACRRISDLRAHLEGYAARHAAMRAVREPSGCKLLKDVLNRLAAALKANDYQGFQQADFDLHTAIIRLAGVPLLYESWLPVWQGLRELHSSSFHECWPDLRVLVQEHVHLVEDICRGEPAAAEETARSHVQAVWYRYAEAQMDSAETDPLQRATAAIAFRLGSPISLKKLAAKIAFTSSGHLSRLFKQHYGVSYRQYVQNLRLEKASRLLTETSLPVAEVAHRVGYNDVSRFGQHLKRLYGVTPRAYRKRS